MSKHKKAKTIAYQNNCLPKQRYRVIITNSNTEKNNKIVFDKVYELDNGKPIEALISSTDLIYELEEKGISINGIPINDPSLNWNIYLESPIIDNNFKTQFFKSIIDNMEILPIYSAIIRELKYVGLRYNIIEDIPSELWEYIINLLKSR